MSEFFVCRTCNKKVVPKNGKLKCCGISERVGECKTENQRHSRAVAREIGKIFDPVESHWNEDDEDFTDHEGIPNFG